MSRISRVAILTMGATATIAGCTLMDGGNDIPMYGAPGTPIDHRDAATAKPDARTLADGAVEAGDASSDADAGDDAADASDDADAGDADPPQ